MGLDFYMLPGSAHCSIVQMTAAAVGVGLNTKVVNLLAGDHLKPEYLKINPQHVVPTLVTEDGVSLWESRGIATYLIEKYGKDDSLYPKDLLKRAIVNQRLYFDMGTLYQHLMERYYPLLFPGFKGRIIPNAEENLKTAVGFFNSFLDGNDFAAGKAYTVAIISLLATTETLKACDFHLSPFPNVIAWYERAKAVTKRFDINEENGVAFRKFFNFVN